MKADGTILNTVFHKQFNNSIPAIKKKVEILLKYVGQTCAVWIIFPPQAERHE